MLDIQIEPYFPTVWKTAQSAAMKSAATQHSTYGRVSSKLFFVSGDKTEQEASRCAKKATRSSARYSRYRNVLDSRNWFTSTSSAMGPTSRGVCN